MLFNSIEFLVFLPIVFILYWFVINKNLKLQNLFIIAASYFFYGWWDWRFLGLIILSSIIDYTIGILLSKSESSKQRKFYLLVSILFNLSILGFFKYYNFFLDSFVDLLNSISGETRYESSWSLSIILPIGISFYTFQTMSYTIDVYRKRMKATKDIIAFFAFVTFFPQLVAGPIERASNLLPQFFEVRKFEYKRAADGCRQILWGFFKKVAIADTCSILVNDIFANYEVLSGEILILGAILFAIQIYGDFSGYSDIAIGTASLFGFKLLANFKTPYFAASTADLWRRWHISLSQWANEYIFFPLTSYYSKFKSNAIILSLVITFTIIGLWHGANWTFVIFGLWHGIVSVVEYVSQKNRRNLSKKIGKNFFNVLGWIITIIVWLVGVVFFRSETLSDSINYFAIILDPTTYFQETFYAIDNFSLVDYFGEQGYLLTTFFIFLFFVEWLNRNYEHGLERLPGNIVVRWGLYLTLIVVISFYFGQEVDFIYFQF